jgi:N-acetylglucosamine kinase
LSFELSAYLERPVYVINDANAFALAEARLGQAKGHDVVLAVILGTGIGGGIVVNGHILCGADGTAGEWGHSAASAIRTGVELPKFACNCGQLACLDTFGGARGLERLYSYFGSSSLDTIEASVSADSHSIIKAWLNKEPLAVQVIDVWLDVVGSALAAAVNLLGTSVVPVGGGLANSKPLIEALDKEVRNRCLASFPLPLLYSAVSGPEQGLVGAAIHAQSQLP